MASANFYDCIIVGGGIAGVSCAESLAASQPSRKILVISASPVVKIASNARRVTRALEEFDVEEQSFSWLHSQFPNVAVILGEVREIDSDSKRIKLVDGDVFSYCYLCLCSGGRPKLLDRNNPYVIGIRDTETVQDFQNRLQNARRILIVGNGGIATELVSELRSVDVIWAIKDSSISATFVDPGAAEFLLDSWRIRQNEASSSSPSSPTISKRLKYTIQSQKGGGDTGKSSVIPGSALGPDWAERILLSGKADKKSDLIIEYNCQVQNISSGNPTELENSDQWPVYVTLTNGKTYGCDFVVSATGVEPNLPQFVPSLSSELIGADGGIKVDQSMETGVRDVFAAGDVCTASWEWAPHWFQMRLWTQARQMGLYAGECISCRINGNLDEVTLPFAFEIFMHSTKFFGFKVVLLGLFNGQKLNGDFEVLLRVTKGVEFVKVVVKDGKMQGAVLIGETDLEETFENLVANGTDISGLGENLLNPDVDIEDFFD